MVVDDVVDLAVDGAVDCVHEAVTLAAAGMLEKRCREYAFAFRRKGHLDGIIHAARHHRFHQTTFRAAAEYVRGAGFESSTFGAFVRLFGESPFAPIDPTIQT